MDKKVERWFPLLIGVLTAAFYIYFLRNYFLPSSVKDLFSSTMQISSILIGFLITALSILVTIEDKKIIQQLKRMGLYNKLLNYFMDATKWSFCLVIASSIGLLINFDVQQSWHSSAFAAWLFVLTTTMSSCYRVIDIFADIIRS
ncbi:hypothetical protein [Synechocystis sp. PCC 7509]|uniref:hypothetical protein n=1 Tax=Synechocystis sp. PCC 7509 TaxID=927677 RepID=UPI0002AC1A19|nr:hypothetical protein [Synechocystis sp. PCC 7509]